MERIVHLRWARTAAAAVLLLVVAAGFALGSGEPGTLTSWTVPTASSTPSGILVVDGVVYFGESAADQLGRLDPATNAVTEWNVGDGPQELALGPAGGVYVTERWGDRIGRIMPGGGFYTSETAGATGSEPTGIASDLTGVGTLWYTQRAAGKLTRLSLGGLLFDVLMVQFPSTQSVTPSSTPLVPTTLTAATRVTPGNPFLPPGIALAPSTTAGPYVHYEIGGTGTYLRDLAIAPDGTIYVSTEARSIRQFNPSSGTLLYHDLPADSAAYYVDVDDAGAVWFTESGLARVGRLNPSTGDVVEWTIPSSQPLGILAAPDGTVWFTDRTGDRIGHLEPATNTVTLYPLAAGSRPTDLTLDAAGDVWFVTEANWIGRLALGPVLGTPPLAEGITGIRVTATSPTEAVVTIDYVYSGSAGLPIFVGGMPTIGGADTTQFGYVPGTIPAVGAGSVSYPLTYLGSTCLTTDGFRAYLYGADRSIFVMETASVAAVWGPCISIAPAVPGVSISVDRGCGGSYAIGNSISISITPSETVTASLVDFQTGGTQSVINVGTIPAGATRVVNGTITGPVGTEAVVVRAQTTAGVWVSAGCTFAVGGASLGTVSVGVDRGCGATYHYGETATAILQSSVAGLAKLYQVTRSGAVSLVTVLPIFPGVTERVSAPIGATTGASTFVLEVTAASGQLHAATCSYSVIP